MAFFLFTKAAVKRKVTAYYRRMAREFEDGGIRSPFERDGKMSRTRLPAIERKSLASVQVIEERVVTGFPAVMGNVDDGGDVLLPGAFAKTLAERGDRLRYLWMHDATQMPVANIVAIGEVGREELPAELLARYPEALGALKVSREYLETPRGEEALVGIRKGAIKEMSFAYDALAIGEPDEALRWGKGCRRLLKEVRLWECSDVNWGMNPATMNLKAALAGLPEEPGPERRKALAEWLEANLHLRFTELADSLFGDGYLTREERIALSGLIGDALDAFNAGMQDAALSGVRERERWEAPEPAGEEYDESGEPETDGADLARKVAEALLNERRRRIAVARHRLALA